MALDQNNLQSGKKLNDTLDFDLLPPCPPLNDSISESVALSSCSEKILEPSDCVIGQGHLPQVKNSKKNSLSNTSNIPNLDLNNLSSDDFTDLNSNGSRGNFFNGRGMLFKQKCKQSYNSPHYKGSIILDNKKYRLAGWICSVNENKSKYISLSISEFGRDIKGEKTYIKHGNGYLRYSKPTSDKAPSLRGEIKLDNKSFSLSAWGPRKGEKKMNINSHPIIPLSYSEVQEELTESMNSIHYHL